MVAAYPGGRRPGQAGAPVLGSLFLFRHCLPLHCTDKTTAIIVGVPFVREVTVAGIGQIRKRRNASRHSDKIVHTRYMGNIDKSIWGVACPAENWLYAGVPYPSKACE